jgi:hypothetical protein
LEDKNESMSIEMHKIMGDKPTIKAEGTKVESDRREPQKAGPESMG